ncbi:MAG: DUF3592 domain-containing protein [Clostridia bacterium]|nr:DUF3592 domain-containing protein [Clostridia bacterium]
MSKPKNGRFSLILVIVIAALLCLWEYGFSGFSDVWYRHRIADMEPVEATVVDTDLHDRRRNPDIQEVSVTYEVDGETYQGELDMAVKSLFVGRRVLYSVGDKITLYYDAENPYEIAYPNSAGFLDFFSFAGMFVLLLIVLVVSAIARKRRQAAAPTRTQSLMDQD